MSWFLDVQYGDIGIRNGIAAGIGGGCREQRASNTITLQQDTVITIAKITLTGIHTIAAGAKSVVLKWNNQDEFLRLDWAGVDTGQKAVTRNALGLIANGSNMADVVSCWEFGAFPFTDAYHSWQVDLHMEGTGTAPSATPPAPDYLLDIWNAVKPFVPILAIAGGILGALWLVGPELREELAAARGGIRGITGGIREAAGFPTGQPIIVVR